MVMRFLLHNPTWIGFPDPSSTWQGEDQGGVLESTFFTCFVKEALVCLVTLCNEEKG